MYKIQAINPITHEHRDFLFDEQTSSYYFFDKGRQVKVQIPHWLYDFPDVQRIMSRQVNSTKERILFSPENPGEKNETNHNFILIRLGSKCNYKCTYCAQTLNNQDSVLEDTTNNINVFIEKLINIIKPDGNPTIMFYGGEPFVYWKRMKTIVEQVKQHRPNVNIHITTNGSVLDREKIEFMKKYFNRIIISHDGPGQCIRNEKDYLDDPIHLGKMKELAKHFGDRFEFSSVLSKVTGFSRAAINDHFAKYFDGVVFNVNGGHISNYFGEYIEETNFSNVAEAQAYAKLSYEEIRNNLVFNFQCVKLGVSNMLASAITNKPIEFLSVTRCGFDSKGKIAVDIDGNILTCGNVSAQDISYNGYSHNIGSIDDLKNVKMQTGIHPLLDSKCRECPVLLSCFGGCFFFDGEVREKNCDNMFFGYIGTFAYVFELITGYQPVYMDHPNFPEYKKDFFGLKNLQKVES